MNKEVKDEKEEEMNRIFGERLRMLRAEAKLSTRDLARKAEISGGMVSAIENGRSSASAVKVLKIAKVLNTTVEHLLGEDEYLKGITESNLEISRENPTSFEKLILMTYKFPNGLTYKEMEDKLKSYADIEEKLSKIEAIFSK